MKAVIFGLLLASSYAFPGKDLSEAEFEEKYQEIFEDKDLEKKAAEFLEKAEKEIDAQHEKFEKGEANFDESIHEQDDMDPKEWEKISEGLNMDDSRNEFYHGLIWDPNEKNTPEELERLAEIDREQLTPAAYLPWSYDSPYQTAVQSQGSCGSCAAFATAAGIESCLMKASYGFSPYSNTGLDIAEQHLLDCAYGQNGAGGCQGAGLASYSSFIVNKQVIHEHTYPYMAKTYGNCKALPYWNPGSKVVEQIKIVGPSETQIKQLIHTYGHAMVPIHASDSDFSKYSDGVYDTCPYNGAANHLVLATGWGTENGIKYWKIKNSWGSSWGNGGYIKVKRGTCKIDKGAVSLRCVSNGSKDPIPVDNTSKPPKACNMNYFKTDLTGRKRVAVTDVNGSTRRTWCNCQHGFCTPEKFDEKTNSCIEICGVDPCPPAKQPCKEKWIGDGWCDKVNNNEACKYDGGDCK